MNTSVGGRGGQRVQFTNVNVTQTTAGNVLTAGKAVQKPKQKSTKKDFSKEEKEFACDIIGKMAIHTPALQRFILRKLEKIVPEIVVKNPEETQVGFSKENKKVQADKFKVNQDSDIFNDVPYAMSLRNAKGPDRADLKSELSLLSAGISAFNRSRKLGVVDSVVNEMLKTALTIAEIRLLWPIPKPVAPTETTAAEVPNTGTSTEGEITSTGLPPGSEATTIPNPQADTPVEEGKDP